jgi:hypothetical protein
MHKLTNPLSGESPSIPAIMTKATTMSAQYSAGPKTSARRASGSAAADNATVASVPATNDPIAAVDSAAPPRPRRAMRCPSMAVTTVALSPGVFSRIEVVEPPYIAP